MPSQYQPRVYRTHRGAPDLVAWRTVLAETDLLVQAEADLREAALQAVREARTQIEHEILRRPAFADSLAPLEAPSDAPLLVGRMYLAAARAGVGPLAAVAGAVAQYVAERLLPHSPQVIVENGGDLYLATACERVVAIEAGTSPLSGRVGLLLAGPSRTGVCTSSGTVGHSLSAGRADAAVVLAPDAALADAVATAVGNHVLRPEDSEEAVAWALTVPGVSGALVVCGATLAAAGQVRLQPIGADRAPTDPG